MKRALVSLWALAALAVPGHAQQVGDTEQAVIKALGSPPMTRKAGDRQIWIYSDGTKVVLKGGVVVEARMGAPAPTAPREEVAVTEPAPAPPVNVPRTVAPRMPPRAPQLPAFIPQNGAPRHRSPLGLALGVAGSLLMFGCGIMILVAAFRESPMWGIAVLIVPFAQIVFVLTHWAETKKPFLLIWLVGVPLLAVGFAIDFGGGG